MDDDCDGEPCDRDSKATQGDMGQHCRPHGRYFQRHSERFLCGGKMRQRDLSGPRLTPQDGEPEAQGPGCCGGWEWCKWQEPEKYWDTRDGPIPLRSVGRMASKADTGSAAPSAVSSWWPQGGCLTSLGLVFSVMGTLHPLGWQEQAGGYMEAPGGRSVHRVSQAHCRGASRLWWMGSP